MLVISGTVMNDRIIPETKLPVPNGTRVSISVNDEEVDLDGKVKLQIAAFKKFCQDIDEIDEDLPPAFDEIIARGIKFREVDFSEFADHEGK
jgi:methyl coenzyme M reductase subunit D